MQTRYDKGADAIPIPLTVKRLEAERMGRLNPLPEALKRRPVPENSDEFNQHRAEYKRALGDVRKQFSRAWDERRKREAAAAEEVRAAARARKEHGDMVRSEQRRAALASEEHRRELQRQAKAELKAESARTHAAEQARIAHLRQRWLKALVKDSQRWVPEDKIEEMITPATFSMKYSWHLEGWFAAKDRKRALMEQMRRSKRPGVPLTEVSLPDSDPASAYGQDWESDDEAFSAAAAAADADAKLDASGRVSDALAVARRVAREEDLMLPEPAYDSTGAPLPPQGTATPAAKGIGLLNLMTGKASSEAALSSLLSQYEAYLEEQAGRLSPAAQHIISSHVRASDGSIPVDDGERQIENDYITSCVLAEAVEALYYALLRKQARLVREGHKDAHARFQQQWGDWIARVDERVAHYMAVGGPEPDDDAPPAPPSRDAAAARRQAEVDASVDTITSFFNDMSALQQQQEDGDKGMDDRNIKAAQAVARATAQTPLPAGGDLGLPPVGSGPGKGKAGPAKMQ